MREKIFLLMYPNGFKRGNTIFTKLENTSLSVQTSGGDALLGNTRPHPEHDG